MKKNNKGFAGLINLTSDISEIYTETEYIENNNEGVNSAVSTPIELTNQMRKEAQQNVSDSQSKEPEKENSSSHIPVWIIGFSVIAVILLIIRFSDDKPSSNYVNSRNTVAQETAQIKNKPQSTIPEKPVFPKLSEPSIGIGKVLNVEEIRWCVANDIILSEMQKEANFNNDVINYYNGIVEDYNARCGQYQYRKGDLTRAKNDIEPFRRHITNLVKDDIAKFKKPAREVSKNKKDPLVENIQILLISHGYNPGDPDGYIGNKTIRAIKEFQKDYSLLVDGKATEALLFTLRNTAISSTRKKSSNLNSSYFSIGSTKEVVRSIHGTPTSIIGNMWLYKYDVIGTDLTSNDIIYFSSQGRVTGWANNSGRLKVR